LPVGLILEAFLDPLEIVRAITGLTHGKQGGVSAAQVGAPAVSAGAFSE
jgi:hypothetical protein